MLESSRMQQAWMVYSHLDLHSPQHLPAKVCSTAHTETRKASRAHLRLHVHPCRRDVYPYRIHGNALGGDCNADWGDRDGTWADRKACVSDWIAATACASENKTSEDASAPRSYDGAEALQRTVQAHLADDTCESHHRSL